MIEQPVALTGAEGRILCSETGDRILKHNDMEPDEEHLMMIATKRLPHSSCSTSSHSKQRLQMAFPAATARARR
jgi:hypothetical protein